VGALQRTAIRCVGVCCVVTAAVGLYWSAFLHPDAGADLAGEAPHLRAFLYPMRAICFLCLTALILIGHDFVRLRTRARKVLISLLAFELIYYAIIRLALSLVQDNSLGVSFSYAYILASVGFVPQIVCVLPLWALPLTWWATRETGRITGRY
jgi:hypothetical protein